MKPRVLCVVAAGLVLCLGIRAWAQEPWVYQPHLDIRFPQPDSLVHPYLCTFDSHDNLWVISSSAATPGAMNALFKASPGDTVFTLVVDYTTDLNIESTRGITAIGDTIYVVSRMPGTPTPSLAIMYEYLDGDPQQRNAYSGSGYGTWVLGLSANRDKYIYASVSFRTSIRVYNMTDQASPRGYWVPILPIEYHPSEPGGHDGTGRSIIRDVAVIPGADYSLTNTPFYTSRNSDSTGRMGGVAVWTGGTQTDPKGYVGQRVTDVAADLSWLWWTPYGLCCDRSGNLYACGTDTTRRWVKVFSVMGNFAVEFEELPARFSSSRRDPSGAPMLEPTDVALSSDERSAYVIDGRARRAFAFRRGGTKVAPALHGAPKSCDLLQVYPNPFNADTRLRFELAERQAVRLKVLNARGEVVQVLLDGVLEAGPHEMRFSSEQLATGVYLIQLRGQKLLATTKVVLLK
ncbi:MAG: T9SS type A sorting domain-containing protein [candidate division KSB1 bacterium]|nr:T9SS type A sorting domain-containing protein [candidate division KSB1 bacterium]MDZ7392082.1 T9SS type A sorting domain-containing protein [candidate division KSB1 bacterium]